MRYEIDARVPGVAGNADVHGGLVDPFYDFNGVVVEFALQNGSAQSALRSRTMSPGFRSRMAVVMVPDTVGLLFQ